MSIQLGSGTPAVILLGALNTPSGNLAADSKPGTAHQQSHLSWIIPLILLGVLVLMYFLWPAFHTLVNQAYQVLASEQQHRIEQWVRGFGVWGFVVIFALMLMQTLVPVLPSVVAMVAAVLAYGPWLGGAIAWCGMLLAASLGYAIGRSFGPVTLDRLMGKQTRRKVSHQVHRHGVWAVIAARLSPVLSTDAVSIIAGLVSMRFRYFLLATAAGTLPLAALIAFLGQDIDRLKTGLVWISVFSVAAFLAYLIYDRRHHGTSN